MMSTWTSTTHSVSLSIAAIPTLRATPLLSEMTTVIAELAASARFVPGRDVLGRAVLIRAVAGRDVLGRVERSMCWGATW